MTGAPKDYARELYPFLYEPTSNAVAGTALLEAVQRSTREKCQEVIALRRELLAEYAAELLSAAGAMATRFIGGGKLFAFGNGGSATDADDAAVDCVSPPVAGWHALSALSLPADSATVTALGNDVGVEHVFVRQLIALGEPGDIALGFSTSGSSPNIVAALGEAKRRGMLTIAFTGYDGGAMLRDGKADYCFVARREFVPRIQEGHATVWHVLLELVQDALLRGPR